MRQYDETGETLDATGDLSNAYHAADGRRREASEAHPVNLNPYRSGSKPTGMPPDISRTRSAKRAKSAGVVRSAKVGGETAA
ncbi:MAG: hypothetical protein ACI92G_004764 [Candidatus Pelagisphaera sp.]|jgi:hypothetical protein